MPNVTVYIRQADLALWKACDNKAQLVSDALNSNTPDIATIDEPLPNLQAHKMRKFEELKRQFDEPQYEPVE